MDTQKAGTVKEPIAIIGMGCRFPGNAHTPQAFWQLLLDEKDTVSKVPLSRWEHHQFYHPDPTLPGKMYTAEGSFLEQYDQFDAAFFGISPAEAQQMDPQQRLLLEASWEALEDAGVIPGAVAGSQTGVFIGICGADYGAMQRQSVATINAYTNACGSYSIAANRLSYFFDFQGPSLSVDTACSSALVGVHLACESLWKGECSLAMAGGAHLILDPGWNIGFCKAQMLSPGGRCRSFDEEADGYVRGEGVGIVVLKPLAQALRDGNPIHALIRATAINQDGKTASLHQPSRAAQETLLRQVYAQAEIDPRQVYYVEAHGTGTPVGDRVEATALGSVLGRKRASEPWLRIGSVKTNIGHLEGASGMAALLKAILVLKHRQIPANLHFQTPHPNIYFEQLHLKVPQASEVIPSEVSPLVVGINNFGFGGTNAHIVLQEFAESRAQIASEQQSSYLFPLSARSPEALRQLAQAYLELLRTDEQLSLHDLCYSVSRKREQHPYRQALVVRSRDELQEALQAYLASEPLSQPAEASGRPKIAFVYAGNGPQWWAMGRQLWQEEPLFREIIERCDQAFRRSADWSLIEALLADEAHSEMQRTDVAQPALFALQIGLTALWQAWGIAPQAVIGHSVGEIAAAYVAGVLSLEDAVRVVFERSRCQQLTAGTGKMLAASISAEEAEQLLAPYAGRISLAAINSPTAVTLSGEETALNEVRALLDQREIFCRLLPLDYAFHSHAMDPICADVLTSLADLQPGVASLPFVSTVSGELLSGRECGASYWWDNIRQPVRFAAGIQQLLASKTTIFLEIGPHPVLSPYISECMAQLDKKGMLLPSLRRKEEERRTLLTALGALYTHGYALCWEALASEGRSVPLPLYPWQHQRYWLATRSVGSQLRGAYVHPLLGYRLPTAEMTWENTLDTSLQPYLAEHVVQQIVVFPAAGYVEMALAAASSLFAGEETCAVEHLEIRRPLILTQTEPPLVQLTISQQDHAFHIYSRKSDEQGEWTEQVMGKIRPLRQRALLLPVDLDAVRERCQQCLPGVPFYQGLVRRGLQLGPAFQVVENVFTGDGEALGIMHWPGTSEEQQRDFLVHPLLLDGCFQTIVSLVASQIGGAQDHLYLPVSLEQFRLYRAAQPGSRFYSYIRLVQQGIDYYKVNGVLLDEAGEVIAEIMGLRVQMDHATRILREALANTGVYQMQWHAQPRPAQLEHRVRNWLIFADDSGVAEQIQEQLAKHAGQIISVKPGESYQRLSAQQFLVRPQHAEDMQQMRDTLRREQWHYEHILYLWGLQRSEGTLTASVLNTSVETSCLGLLNCVQTLGDLDGQAAPRLWIVTGGVHAFPETLPASALAQAPLYGLGRVIGNEHPEWRTTLLDVSALETSLDGQQASEIVALCEELLQERADESELLLRGPDRYVNRIEHAPLEQPLTTDEVLKQPAGSYRLSMETAGVLDNLSLRAVPRLPPQAGEVEIAVAVAGMNFKDIMVATGVLAGETLAHGYAGGFALGLECAGTVVRVGAGVTDFAVGDDVIAMGRNCLSAYLTTNALFVAHKPAHLGAAEGATILSAFLTAYYALHTLGHIRKGERVLIHGAAGGVGLAAIQIVQQAGGEVFATAGSAEKRAYLRSLGVTHILDSRSLAFADEIMQITHGEGVDIVLNSLAGEALEKSLQVLRRFGRFLEIGKRDIVEKKHLELLPFERCLSYITIDIDQLQSHDAPLFHQLLQEVMERVERGLYLPLPLRQFPLDQAVDAFRYLQQARHIGKVIVSLQQPAVPVRPERQESAALLRADAAYLIIGGTRGFGLATAQWMVKQGAQALALVHRSGKLSAAASEAITAMRAVGTQVLVIEADVTQAEAVASLLEQVRQTLPPLRGILHAAVAFEDGPVMKLTAASWKHVIAPKMLGAWHLHQQTKETALDFFVLYSSISALIGNPGQGSYAAANMFLNAFSAYRHVCGLPALAIEWGALAQVGYVAQHNEVKRHLAQRGVQTLSPEQALGVLEQLLRQPRPLATVAQVQWQRVAERLLAPAARARVMHLLTEEVQGEEGTRLAEDMQADPQQRLQIHLRQALGRMLNVAGSEINLQSTASLQLDSLMVMELRNGLKQKLGLEISTLHLLQARNLQEMSTAVARRWEDVLQTV